MKKYLTILSIALFLIIAIVIIAIIGGSCIVRFKSIKTK